uniref:Uncharacterized protein n=1 Tax=Amphimedon queenslandica TaxID=400682 RepID=A0A1X7TZ93_AMPQE
MSLRNILDKVKGLDSRLSDLTTDVEDLKKKDQAQCELNKVESRHSCSRCPYSRSKERAGQHSGKRYFRANRTESYLLEDEEDFKQLMEVSEETHCLLTDSCMRGRVKCMPSPHTGNAILDVVSNVLAELDIEPNKDDVHHSFNNVKGKSDEDLTLIEETSVAAV